MAQFGMACRPRLRENQLPEAVASLDNLLRRQKIYENGGAAKIARRRWITRPAPRQPLKEAVEAFDNLAGEKRRPDYEATSRRLLVQHPDLKQEATCQETVAALLVFSIAGRLTPLAQGTAGVGCLRAGLDPQENSSGSFGLATPTFLKWAVVYPRHRKLFMAAKGGVKLVQVRCVLSTTGCAARGKPYRLALIAAALGGLGALLSFSRKTPFDPSLPVLIQPKIQIRP
ncbi:MAG: hypothetical protein KF770_10945 [Anaerolineae bacterium]|nr:hypothetical protein [Anaerolineae bacterium]